MYWRPSPDNAPVVTSSLASRVSMAVLAVLIFVAGVYPSAVFVLLPLQSLR
jgi:hypothetical protein